MVAPLLRVQAVAHDTALPDRFIPVFTSSNAVRHAGITGPGAAIVVGDATGMAAREAGFSPRTVGEGDVKSLVQALVTPDAELKTWMQAIERGGLPLIHFCGERLAGDVVDGARMAGLTARKVVVYRTVAADAAPDFPSPPSLTALYSPFAARTFERLAPADWPGTVVCLSEAVAKQLSGRRVVVAERPTQAALIRAAHREMDGDGH